MMGFNAVGFEPVGYFGPDLLDDGLKLNSTAPILAFSGSTAELEQKVVARLAANAPALALTGSAADLYTKARIDLETAAPALSLAGSDASLHTRVVDELAANAPSLSITGSSAELFTKQRTLLDALAPSLSITGSAAQIVTTNLAVIVPPQGNVNPGDMVSIQITGVPDSIDCNAGNIAIESLDGSGNLMFYAPHPVTFGDNTLTFNSPITITLSNAQESVDFQLVVEPTGAELFGQIDTIDPDGIYADDTVNVGDYAFATNIIGDVILDIASGLTTNSSASSLDYALYDGTWSGYATESFPEHGLSLNASAPSMAFSGSNASIDTSSGLELAATAPTLSISGSSASLAIDAELLLNASAPSVSLSGSSAELLTGARTTLEASAPSLSIAGSTASLATDAEVLLEATAPSLTLAGSSASLFTGAKLSLDAAAPEALALSGSTGQLETNTDLFLNATSPSLSLSGSNALMQLGNLDYIEPRMTISIQHHDTTIIIQAA